jgi:hypothetical protein
MTKDLIDLRGGYFTDIPGELMRDSELLVAENCYWKNGLIKRGGIDKYQASDWSALEGCKGGIRAYINSTWYTIVALDDGSNTKFYAGTGTTFTVIDASYTFTKALNVEFAELNGHVVAVDGTDKPAVIYWDSALVIKDLEQYDVRTRADEEWWAGQYNTADASYDNDTTDAQDAGADDFEIGSTTNSDGCWVACDYPFTKVIFKSGQQDAGSPVTTYKYWNGTAFANLTLTTTPDWTAAEADRTLEFDYPTDWEPFTSSDTYTSNKYLILIQHTTAPGAANSCDSLEVYHTHYLTQITSDVKPQFVYTHGSRLHLFCGSIGYISLLDSVKGWKAGWTHGFWEGGSEVVSACSHNDNLIVFKENTLYRLSGNSFDTWVKSKPLTNVGTIARRSPVMVGAYVFFVSHDGVYLWTGEEAIKVSKHIQTDIDSYTLTTACGVRYKSAYWLSFPSASIVLWSDPDTFRRDDLGDGRVSFFKFKTYKVMHFIYNSGAGDDGLLYAIVDINPSPYILKCDTGTVDDLDGSSSTAIDMKVQTKYFSLGGFMGSSCNQRLKVKFKEVASAVGQNHTLTMYAQDGDVSESVTVKVTVGSKYYIYETPFPYTLDGRVISIEIRHNLGISTTLTGIAMAFRKRRF